MRSAAEIVAEAGADIIDINMGCPVRKVCKTGAGAALLADPDLAVSIASAAREGGGIPVTVKLRSGLARGGREGFDLALRLAEEAGVAAIGFHPRGRDPAQGSAGLRARSGARRSIAVPVIISGGLDSAEAARHAYEASGADAVMIARGSLGNPWIFEELTGARRSPPERDEVIAELLWVMDRAEEHLGRERAARYLRKFYPWYLERLDADGGPPPPSRQSDDLDEARAFVVRARAPGRLGAAPKSPIQVQCPLDGERSDHRVAAWRDRGCDEEFRGRRIHVFDRDGGGPLLLFLHGFPSSSYDWRALLELETEHAVLAPDFLGFGLSEKPRDHDYTLHWQADLVEELVRRNERAGRCSSSPMTWGHRSPTS